MHELSLVADLMRKIEAIVHEHQAEKVVKIKIKLGALAHISASHFREHFVHASRGTVAEGAELEVNVLEDINDPRAQDILLDHVELSADYADRADL